MSGIDRVKNFRSKTSTALAYLDEPVLITDPNGVLVYLNPRGEESLELDLNLAIGRNLHEILPNNLSAGLMDGLERMRKSNRSLQFVISGKDRHYSAQMNPILKEDKMTGAIISLRPERDHEMIRHLNQALFQNLLDDIYRPLNQIAMLFSRDPAAATDADKVFSASQDLVRNAVAALNNLLDVSPILSGEIRLARNRFQPALLLKLAVRSLRGRADTQGVFLFRADQKELPDMVGDQAKLNRILIILLDYLLELTPAGEILALSVDLSLKPSPVLTYSLTATGISKTESDFYCMSCELSPQYPTLDDKEKKKQRTIMIASRLLLAMKGTASVVSLEKVGTTLSFSVPVGAAE